MPRTLINFRGGKDVTVEGAVETIADALREGGPVRLTTIYGDVIFVNWSNVLYIESTEAPAGVLARPRPSR